MSQIVCAKCGSPKVKVMAWVDPNTKAIIDDVGPWQSRRYNYCTQCRTPAVLTREEVARTH